MQKIEIVLSEECFVSVSEALRRGTSGQFRASGVTMYDPKAPPKMYRGAPYLAGRDLLKLEWIVHDRDVQPIIDEVQAALDALGEGNVEVVVYAVAESLRLRPSVWTRPRGAG